jgi:hypothetical protein
MIVGSIKLTHTPTPQGPVPDNARGACSSRNYWMLGEKDRAKYAAGWWAEYDRKPCASHEFAYLLGRQECRVAHSFAQVSVPR